MTTATPPCMNDDFKNEKYVSPVDATKIPKHVVNLKT